MTSNALGLSRNIGLTLPKMDNRRRGTKSYLLTDGIYVNRKVSKNTGFILLLYFETYAI